MPVKTIYQLLRGGLRERLGSDPRNPNDHSEPDPPYPLEKGKTGRPSDVPRIEVGQCRGGMRRPKFTRVPAMGQRVMSKLSERLTYGLVSARSGHFNLKRALKEEWLAFRTAEQDRAHLAAVSQAPLIRVRPVDPSVTFPRSVQPRARN